MSDWFWGKTSGIYFKSTFVQEVAANAIALQDQFDQVGTAIELGGQDAKMIFFKDSENGQSQKCFRYA